MASVTEHLESSIEDRTATGRYTMGPVRSRELTTATEEERPGRRVNISEKKNKRFHRAPRYGRRSDPRSRSWQFGIMLYCMYCTMYVMVLYVMVCYVLPSLSTLVLKFTFCIGDGVPVTSKSEIQLVNYNKNQATVRVCVYVSTPL